MNLRVVNTTPLLFLSKIGKLELLHLGVDRVYVPTSVLRELRVVQDEATCIIEKLLGTWLEEKSCTQLSLLSVAKGSLHEGEAEVIAIALEYNIRDVALDDLDARRFARRIGLQPIGTFGLLLAAKRANLIPKVLPEIQALQRAGFYASEALVKRILTEANET
ncbi:MAG: DUF3368 domain-containing protein [Anaerolineales bacterium]|nr:DUF3368 domain-containing protein [Anaerolineales bacterium]MCS7247577.1 DUF3368 domain-containing protein [Anaerolineales bacterium]MDW8161388.1 DUF3368 domain-containing protein [Anaerolineales bacterium]MDW8447997.1 DUF3368 domain-containing protein [Anaerolineales bacterium]